MMKSGSYGLAAIALAAGTVSGGEAPGAGRGRSDALTLQRVAQLERELERREKQIDRMHKIILTQQKALEAAKARPESVVRRLAEAKEALDGTRAELAELRKKNARLTQDLRHLPRIIQELTDRGVPVRELLLGGEARPPNQIHGKVLAVRPLAISVGSDDGVRKGYRFTIYRDERYVGKVEVREVFPDTSAVTILTDWTKEEIMEGDDASTSLGQRPPGAKPWKEHVLEEIIEIREALGRDRDKHVEMLFRQGVDLFEMRRYAEAADRFRKVLDIAPEAEEARKLLRQAEKAIDRRPGDPSAPPIRGTVLAVRPEVNLVMLSVGSDDGVKRGYRFTIRRGERYIGKVEVERAFNDMCSARILAKSDVKEGDDAATGPVGRPEPGDPPGEAAPGAGNDAPPEEDGEVF